MLVLIEIFRIEIRRDHDYTTENFQKQLKDRMLYNYMAATVTFIDKARKTLRHRKGSREGKRQEEDSDN